MTKSVIVGMDGNTYQGFSRPIHAADSIRLGFYSDADTRTGTKPKFLAALYRGDRLAAMVMTFISVLPNLLANRFCGISS